MSQENPVLSVPEAVARATGEIKQYIDGIKTEFGVELGNVKRSADENNDRIQKAIEHAITKEETKKLLDEVIRDSMSVRGNEGPNLVPDFDMARIKRAATEDLTPDEAKDLYEDFLTSRPANPEVAEFHKTSTNLAILRTWMRRAYPNWELSQSKHWKVRSWLAGYHQMQRHLFGDSFLKRAFDTADATAGADWVPSFMSSDLTRYIEVRGGLIPLLRSVAMPGKVYDLPITTSAGIGHVFVERTTSPTAAYNYTTAELYAEGSGPIDNRRLDAITVRAFIVTSQQFMEDSIIPVIDFLATDTADAIRRALEDAIINGDDATAHFDTLPAISYTPSGASTLHRRTAFNGLRFYINANGANARVENAASTIAFSQFAQVLSKMGRYGCDGPDRLAWVASPMAYFKLLAIQEFATMEKIGARATNVTGQVGAILGSPLVLSEFVRTDLNDDGVAATTANNTTEIIAFHRPSWWIGNWRGISTEPERIPGWDQNVIWARWRGDVIKLWASGEVSEAALTDIRP